MSELLLNYVFHGTDTEGMTDNDTELLNYLYFDYDQELQVAEQAPWKGKPNDVRRTEPSRNVRKLNERELGILYPIQENKSLPSEAIINPSETEKDWFGAT